jgi:hypothetical protein
MIPAIKSSHQSSCIDEKNCNLERTIVCGFNGTNSTAERVTFLSCIDSSQGEAPSIGEACCAAGGNINYKRLLACYNSSLGYELLADAASKYVAARVSVVPAMMVGDQLTPEPYYLGIKDQICSLGSTASVCQ